MAFHFILPNHVECDCRTWHLILSKSAYSRRLLKLHDPYGIPLSRVFGHEVNEVTNFKSMVSLPVGKNGDNLCHRESHLVSMVSTVPAVLTTAVPTFRLNKAKKFGKRLWNGIMGLSLLKPYAVPRCSTNLFQQNFQVLISNFQHIFQKAHKRAKWPQVPRTKDSSWVSM